jgi:hypothetical protein
MVSSKTGVLVRVVKVDTFHDRGKTNPFSSRLASISSTLFNPKYRSLPSIFSTFNPNLLKSAV